MKYKYLIINEKTNEVSIENMVIALEETIKKADILSISCYLTDETRGIISNGVLDNFKDNLIVVNTSRGETVDEEYIYDLIVKDKIFYSCDVLCNEQEIEKLKQSKLFNLKRDNIVITPHVAGATIESQTKALRGILELCIKLR